MPLFDKAIVPGVEVISRSDVKSSSTKDGRTLYSQDYVITSFCDSLFLLPQFDFIVNNTDTFRSDPLSLNVIQPFVIDTTMAITDIKPVHNAPIWWWGILRWVLLVWLTAAIALVGYRIYVKYFSKNKKEEAAIDPELLRPCDEVALEKLDTIREAKIWQTGQHKEYFSELTFVVREYIGRRFAVRSTEKTSDETLDSIKPLLTASDQKPLYAELEKMLRLADLVKFAKWQPTPDENELSLKSAYKFVNETKQTEEETKNDVQRDVNDSDFSTIDNKSDLQTSSNSKP